jgi:hypothetical protein
MRDDLTERLAEHVRRALIERAKVAHEDARLQGLCWEGAWEAAVSAMRDLDLRGAAEAARGATHGDPIDETTGSDGPAPRRSKPLG